MTDLTITQLGLQVAGGNPRLVLTQTGLRVAVNTAPLVLTQVGLRVAVKTAPLVLTQVGLRVAVLVSGTGGGGTTAPFPMSGRLTAATRYARFFKRKHHRRRRLKRYVVSAGGSNFQPPMMNRALRFRNFFSQRTVVYIAKTTRS